MKKFCLYTLVIACLASDSLQLACPTPSNGRQTSSIHFTNPSSNAHLFVVPRSRSATADSGLYYNDITVEMFVNLTRNSSPNAFHPLIGNMEASFGSRMGVASGWRLACRQTTCCFQAFIGYKWISSSVGFDTQFLDDRRTRSFQQVCTEQPVPTSKWFHLAATYSSSNGVATIFVNGVLQAQKSFVAVGDPDFGFDTSLQINYDYTYDVQPWTQNATGAYTLGRLLLAASNASFNPAEAIVPGFFPFLGGIDEVRVWSKAREAAAVGDSAYEVGERGEDCAFVRIASESNLNTTLKLYLRDFNVTGSGSTAHVLNQAPAPAVQLLNVSGAPTVAAETAWYIDQPPLITIDPSAAGTARRVMGPCALAPSTAAGAAADARVCAGEVFVVDPAAAALPLVIELLNYDDRLYLVLPPADPGPVCSGSPPATAAAYCPPPATPPWTRTLAAPFLGPAVDARRATYRTEWAGAGAGAAVYGGEAPVPLGGIGFSFEMQVVKCAMCRTPLATQSVAYRGTWTLQSRPTVALRLQLPLPGAAAPLAADADVLVAVGQTLTLAVTAQAGNPGQPLDIRRRFGAAGASFVLGAAAGAGANVSRCTAPTAVGNYTFTPAAAHAGSVYRECFFAVAGAPATALCTAACAGCAAAEAALASDPLGTRASAADACVWVRVPAPDLRVAALPLPDAAAPGGALDGPGAAAVADTNWTGYPPDQVFTALVGCALGGESGLVIRAQDTAFPTDATTVGQPYALELAPVEEGSAQCHTAGCAPLPGGLPPGATLAPVAPAPPTGIAESALRWRPARGQEGDPGRPYRVCVAARATGAAGAALAAAGRGRPVSVCYRIRVLKCKYCLGPGETLLSLAQQLAIDPLQLLLSNPLLRRPDAVPAGTAVSLGPLYAVRPADRLETLAGRFLVAPALLLALNPDVQAGNGTLAPGGEMCVPAPVCAAQCLHGTDCAL